MKGVRQFSIIIIIQKAVTMLKQETEGILIQKILISLKNALNQFKLQNINSKKIKILVVDKKLNKY